MVKAGNVDKLRQNIAEKIVASGRARFSTVRHDRKSWLGFNILNLYTREEHIHALADWLRDTAIRLTA